MSFQLIYATPTKEHLQAIDQKYHKLIRKTIESQLQFEPDKETRNRKPLKRPVEFGARWEIRFGPENRFRVFYNVNADLNEVIVLAIGMKKGSRLFIGNEEIVI